MWCVCGVWPLDSLDSDHFDLSKKDCTVEERRRKVHKAFSDDGVHTLLGIVDLIFASK